MTSKRGIMRAHGISLGFLAATLLAGSTSLALAWSLKKPLPKLDGYESELPSEYSLDLDPAWKWPETDKGEFSDFGELPKAPPTASTAFSPQASQSAISRAIRSGYSVGAEPEAFPAQLGRGYEVSDSFKAGVRAGFDSPVGDVMNLTTASADARLALGHIGPAISWGWQAGLDMSVLPGSESALASGPQFKLGSDQLALTVSPKVAHTFGTAHSGDVAFAYAAGLKGELTKGVSLGIEAFGATSDIVAAPGATLHNYGTSPGLYVGLGLTPQSDPNESKFSLEIGAMADITEAQPDLTGKLKAAVTW